MVSCFLFQKAAKKRKFQVIVVESAPFYHVSLPQIIRRSDWWDWESPVSQRESIVNQIFLESACLGGGGGGEKAGASEARDIHSFNVQVFDLDLSQVCWFMVGACYRIEENPQSTSGLNVGHLRIKLHISDISNASGQFLWTLIIDILIYIKSIGHCLSPQIHCSTYCICKDMGYWK